MSTLFTFGNFDTIIDLLIKNEMKRLLLLVLCKERIKERKEAGRTGTNLRKCYFSLPSFF
jgi:hypothetical protein